MAALEEVQNKPKTLTYCETSISRPQDNFRLDKLKYFSGEEERKRRINQVRVTHPSKKSDNTQSTEHLKEVLTSVLKFPCREIDANHHVHKTNKSNTVIVRFAHQRFKRFVYAAKKNSVAPNKMLLKFST